jgi:hypothetical protein
MDRQDVDLARPLFDVLRPLIGFGALAAVLAGLLAATLRPFAWEPPRTVNAAAYLPTGGLEFRDLGIALGPTPPPWLDAAIATHALDVSLRVEAASGRQRGPARILTLSQDIHRRNLTVAQEGRDLIIRLRTPETDDNGLPSTSQTSWGHPARSISASRSSPDARPYGSAVKSRPAGDCRCCRLQDGTAHTSWRSATS